MRAQLISRRVLLRRQQQVGKGQAWLVFDAGGELFNYQMGGHCDDHLIEHASAATDVDAVTGAAAKTPRARSRKPDHLTCRAGRGLRPKGFSRSRQPPNTTVSPAGATAPVLARAA